jgi:hypothetical protein
MYHFMQESNLHHYRSDRHWLHRCRCKFNYNYDHNNHLILDLYILLFSVFICSVRWHYTHYKMYIQLYHWELNRMRCIILGGNGYTNVWRYQMANQQLSIEGQTIQKPKEMAKRHIESNTGKSARQGNLRHPRIRFQSFADEARRVSERLKYYPRVSEISLSCTFCRCLILFLTFIRGAVNINCTACICR